MANDQTPNNQKRQDPTSQRGHNNPQNRKDQAPESKKRDQVKDSKCPD